MKRYNHIILLFAILFMANKVYSVDEPSWSLNILNRVVYLQGDKTVSQVTGWQEEGLQMQWLKSVLYSDTSRTLLIGDVLLFFDEEYNYVGKDKLLEGVDPLDLSFYRINEYGDRAIVIAKTKYDMYTMHLFAIHADGSHSLLRRIRATGYTMGRPSISRDGNTILWFEAIGGGGQKIFVLKNASNPDSKPVELAYYRNISDVLLSGDGNWAYTFVLDSRIPNQILAEGERNITFYSHYEDGVWSEMKPLEIDGEILRWSVADTNYDSTYLKCAGGVVERKGDVFQKIYSIKGPRNGGLIGSKISEDGKSVVFKAIDMPHYGDDVPKYHERQPDVLVLAVHENETNEFATNYILAEGYYMDFAYSRLTENILWAAYETDPFGDWGAVEDWALREENQN